jgi:hypothetical protein
MVREFHNLCLIFNFMVTYNYVVIDYYFAGVAVAKGVPDFRKRVDRSVWQVSSGHTKSSPPRDSLCEFVTEEGPGFRRWCFERVDGDCTRLGIYSALKEVQDTAFHSSLVNYVKQREYRIGSALRDLGSPASNETSSRPSSCGTRNSKKTRASGDLMPKHIKEMLTLEKQVDKVMARLCHLISLGPSLDSATKPKPSPVKPPWTLYQPSSRIRPPSAPLAGMRHL